MATGIAQSEWDKIRFPRFARLHLLIKLFPIQIRIRRLLLYLERKRQTEKLPIDFSLTRNFESSAQHFRKHGWVFVEEIFPKPIHSQLVLDTPPFYHFNPIRKIYKSYDTNFVDRKKTFQQFPIIGMMENYFRSDEFVSRFEDFTADKIIGRSVGKLTFTRAYSQSFCIPHLDGINAKNKDASVNFIFFISGTGGSRSGGTCILDNADGDVIFEPTNLTNSCLIYRSDRHYHGFQPMRRGTFRYMISADSLLR